MPDEVIKTAAPICRAQNPELDVVKRFLNAMPNYDMPKKDYDNATEAKFSGWTSTHYQMAKQMALYYTKDDVCHPRFKNNVTTENILKYMGGWARKYYAPNPFTKDLNKYQEAKPTVLYAYFADCIIKGVTSYKEACEHLFGDIQLNNMDKLKLMLNSFTDIYVDQSGNMAFQKWSSAIVPPLVPDIEHPLDEVCFFNYFGGSTTKELSLIPESTLQQIFYGAPGTGKSHTIKDCTKGKDVIRTAFHPDSDYSTFVGAYKPTTKEVPVYSPFGEKVVVAKDADGKPIVEDKIVYEFVEQAFLQAYINAWKKCSEAGDGEQPKEQYLIIEEINRGNCAQIFGDLFQLLDRNDAGFSDYPIKADNDMAKHLKKALGKLEIKAKDCINNLYSEEYDDVVDDVLEGEVLLLPNNLFIWATMNTSDQSLFPIDSAFKRRWEWKYIPISNAAKGWVIEANGNRYDWWAFLEKINSVICGTTSSEDKKLGYFFAKADGNGVISADKFVGKVAFYLWNDVFKDYGFDNEIFKGVNGEPIAFQEFFLADGKANEMMVEKFLRNLELDVVNEDEDEDEEENAKRDFTRYKINGSGKFPKRQVAAELVRMFVDSHPDMTSEEVLKEWNTLPKLVPHFVESQYEYENNDDRADKGTRMRRIECRGDYIYVATHGWSRPDKMKELQDAIGAKHRGLEFSAIDNNGNE